MPLDSCASLLFDRISKANPKEDSNNDFYNSSESVLLNCIESSILNTKTSFYEYPDFTLPQYFGLLCFTYSLGGVVLLYTKKPKFMKNKKCYSYLFPYYAYAYLVIVQGFFSYQADYINMDKDSLFHIYDRILANPLMFLQLVKTILTVRYSKQHILLSTCDVTAFFTAGILFYQSQVAQTQIDIDGFKFWHSMWHCYPLVLIVTTLIGRKMELSREENGNKKERYHPLLSDRVLAKTEKHIIKVKNI